MNFYQFKNMVKDHMPALARRLLTPRNLRAICIGTPKSGTTSIASLFASHYRQQHEAERDEHVGFLHEHYLGKFSDADYIDYLQRRDHRLWLDLESNCFLGYRPDLVYRCFPEHRYLLTIRDPLSWLNSIVDNNLNFPITRHVTMARWHQFFFNSERFEYQAGEELLKVKRLYPIESYFSYWRDFNRSIIDTIPASQLLILPTHRISQEVDRIADFLDIPAHTIAASKSHANKTTRTYNIVDQIAPELVDRQIERYCQPLMDSLEVQFATA